MTTAIDTNVIVALWNHDDTLNTHARNALDEAAGRGRLVVSAPVFAELLAFPSRKENFVAEFCRDTGILVEWTLAEGAWRLAGMAFQAYAARRRRQRSEGPRRILTDFLIGAHANYQGYRLLTLDDRIYRAAFPKLHVIAV